MHRADGERGLCQGRGKLQRIAAPDVFREIAKNNAQGNRRHDPARFRAGANRLANAEDFHDHALYAAKGKYHRQHEQIRQRSGNRLTNQEIDCRETDQCPEHQRLALPKVKGLRGGECQLIAEGDRAVDHPDRDTTDDKLREDVHQYFEWGGVLNNGAGQSAA